MASRKKPVLGRNLSSMLSESTLKQMEGRKTEGLQDIPLELIRPGRERIRSLE